MSNYHRLLADLALRSAHAMGIEALLRRWTSSLHYFQLLSPVPVAGLAGAARSSARCTGADATALQFCRGRIRCHAGAFHLLISEPQEVTPSVVVQAIKLSFVQRLSIDADNSPTSRKKREKWGTPAKPCGPPAEIPGGTPRHIWQRRFYDFNVWTDHKRIEKLRYIHRNPVKRGLVAAPEDWAWSSFRAYAFGEVGRVRVNDWDVLKMKVRKIS